MTDIYYKYNSDKPRKLKTLTIKEFNIDENYYITITGQFNDIEGILIGDFQRKIFKKPSVS